MKKTLVILTMIALLVVASGCNKGKGKESEQTTGSAIEEVTTESTITESSVTESATTETAITTESAI